MDIVHIKRTFLRRTETFVYTQVTRFRNGRLRFVTRELENADNFPGVDVQAYVRQGPSSSRIWSNFVYRLIRQMSLHERRFYIHHIGYINPDLIHAHFLVDACYFAPVLRHISKPLVISCYGYDVSSFPGRFGGMGRFYLRNAIEIGTVFLAMTDDMRRDLLELGCPASRVIVHYHGIDLRNFPYTERNRREQTPIRILFVGSLIDKKGVVDLMRAFARLNCSLPNCELRYVGEGPQRSELERLAKALDIQGQVSFAGFTPHTELNKEYADADIFCHPSAVDAMGNKEGIPGTIVEAMATGLPVVSTWHAGIPEIIRDGQTGILVSEHDVDALVSKLQLLIEHIDLRLRLGQAGSLYIRKVGDADAQARKLEAIYEDVVARASQTVSRV